MNRKAKTTELVIQINLLMFNVHIALSKHQSAASMMI